MSGKNEILIGILLLLPIILVIGLIPADSFLGNIGGFYTAQQGTLFQVWANDFATTLANANWPLIGHDLVKYVLIIGATLAAFVGLIMLLTKDSNPPDEPAADPPKDALPPDH